MSVLYHQGTEHFFVEIKDLYYLNVGVITIMEYATYITCSWLKSHRICGVFLWNYSARNIETNTSCLEDEMDIRYIKAK